MGASVTFYKIFTVLVGLGATLTAAGCLLRFAMRWRTMSFTNPVGDFALALSDWIVVPLQRVFRPGSPFDTASLVAAWLLKMLEYATLMPLAGASGRWGVLPVTAVLGVLKLGASVASAVIVIAVVLTLMRRSAVVADVLLRLSAPLLSPLRKRLPRLRSGGDLSPFVAVVLLQVAALVLGWLQLALAGNPALVGMG